MFRQIKPCFFFFFFMGIVRLLLKEGIKYMKFDFQPP